MRTVYSERHRARDARTELSGGELISPLECPRRAELVLAAVLEAGLGPVVAPESFGLDEVHAVHDPAYVAFLGEAWPRWRAAGHRGEAIPSVFPVRRSFQRVPRDIEGALGYWAFAAETSISEGTWQAALAAKDTALTAAGFVLAGDTTAFALCRPPGHHAGVDLFGGYCFLNNAAIAAQALRHGGAARVAVLDVDFHHGNGTQDVFYDRDDVLVVSWHGDPADAFPHFAGYADETGGGVGLGCNVNLPLPPGTAWHDYAHALDVGLGHVAAFAPDALVVSLGVDGFADDPIGFFRLRTEDFRRLGSRLGALAKPTLYVLEGGYAIAAIGANVAAVLEGHLDR